MRHSIVSTGLSLQDMQTKCTVAGGTHIKVFPKMGQIFCELSPAAVKKLSEEPGLKVKPVGVVRPSGVVTVPKTDVSQETDTSNALKLIDIYAELRDFYAPALLGTGLTVAVLDSGIRETHEALEGKVIYSKNFTQEPDCRDIFGHGTGVAYIIAGEANGRSGVAPGAKIMSIKILNNIGVGTTEEFVEAVEHVCDLVQAAIDEQLLMTDEMYPNTLNLSVGAEDTGDPDDPIRVACRVAVQEYGLQIIAAAGNTGPTFSTIQVPAVDPYVVAVGGLRTWEFIVWELSSRGPTLEGYIKPDLVCWAENIEVASHKADNEYEVKSGTSFSTPILVGVDGLLWELTRRIHGETARVTYYDWLPYAPYFTVKPEGAPTTKDSTYGYGIPAVGPMVTQIMGRGTAGSVLESVVPIMMLMTIMPMMMGMAAS